MINPQVLELKGRLSEDIKNIRECLIDIFTPAQIILSMRDNALDLISSICQPDRLSTEPSDAFAITYFNGITHWNKVVKGVVRFCPNTPETKFNQELTAYTEVSDLEGNSVIIGQRPNKSIVLISNQNGDTQVQDGNLAELSESFTILTML